MLQSNSSGLGFTLIPDQKIDVKVEKVITTEAHKTPVDPAATDKTMLLYALGGAVVLYIILR